MLIDGAGLAQRTPQDSDGRLAASVALWSGGYHTTA